MAAILNAAMAIITATGLAAVVWGFRASRRAVSEATWWFLLAFGLIALSLILRSLYWDVFWALLLAADAGAAEAWSDATGGSVINLFFGALKLGAVYCGLKCRQMLIPESERSHWPWWRAWMHPTRIRLLRWP